MMPTVESGKIDLQEVGGRVCAVLLERSHHSHVRGETWIIIRTTKPEYERPLEHNTKRQMKRVGSFSFNSQALVESEHYCTLTESFSALPA